jgi:hypothetical protein
VARVVGGIAVEDEALGLFAVHPLEEHLDQQAVDLADLAGGGGVLESAEGGLAAQRPGLVGRDGLEDGVVAEAGMVVGVLVPGDQAEQALAEHLGEKVRIPGRAGRIEGWQSLLTGGHAPLEPRRPMDGPTNARRRVRLNVQGFVGDALIFAARKAASETRR